MKFKINEAYFANYELLKSKYDKHVTNGKENDGDASMPSDMNIDEYSRLADELSMSEAGSLMSDSIIKGYRTQSGKYVKFKPIDDSYVYVVVYKGYSDVGETISLYKQKLAKLLRKADPFNINYNNKDDFRYFSDIDGKTNGLFIFNPRKNNPSITKEEINNIKNKIKNKQKLSV